MRALLHAWLTAATAAIAWTGAVRAEEPLPPMKLVGQCLDTYCLDCHDSATQKGERNLESFKLPLKSVSDLISAKEIIDQVTLKEMPPKKSDQPTDEER